MLFGPVYPWEEVHPIFSVPIAVFDRLFSSVIYEPIVMQRRL